ncbi:glutathionylspermidine synthase family protein [Leptolyngbya sp. GGD]|uniref:glutathionylspermidine synthase family protein n=1 Tax=Leptolyngbya sp. GGD TaxID=2997907 RepID=UPI00227CFB5F|nr:glutathionylspermidine synthase family protein [Leptolyngbya sp. GGD]MCY6494256.1 glutathionylspermidine synthase family protein [Leptolyngbya sp. GGD]
MTLNRSQFYEQYRHVFSWFDTEDEYACFDVFPVERDRIQAIRQVAEDVWRVLVQAGELMKTFDDEKLLAYGYPIETLDLIRTNTQPPFIARCDFAVTEEGIYLLECNAEVATFVVETFKMNDLVAQHLGREGVNAEAESILRRELNRYIEIASNSIGKRPEGCRIVFSALSQASEDIGTVEYIRSLCEYDTHFCAIEFLSMDEDGIYDQAGEPVDLIYRVYPTEWMVEDCDPTSGVRLWDYLKPLVFERKVALINPISSFVLQNKALLALITDVWSNQIDHPLSSIVHRHFLPTVMTPNLISIPYVGKPTFGREGQEVEIVREVGAVLYNGSAEYAAFPKVYQKYVDLPTVKLNGKHETLQLSCFLMNGVAAGISARVGDKVIGNLSKFLPVCYS